jgi:hypothetical protein
MHSSSSLAPRPSSAISGPLAGAGVAASSLPPTPDAIASYLEQALSKSIATHRSNFKLYHNTFTSEQCINALLAAGYVGKGG